MARRKDIQLDLLPETLPPKVATGKIAVLVDLLVAFLLCLTGALLGAGSCRPTHLSQDPSHRCKDILDSRPDFAVFNHRGPLLRSRQL